MRREEIFERLDPPPGGLAALRARVDPRPSRARRVVPLGLTIAAAVVVFLVVRGRGPDLVTAARERGDASAVALGLTAMPAATAAIEPEDRASTALARVRTEDARVTFYWVSSTAWKD
jgi:hypothetical protein